MTRPDYMFLRNKSNRWYTNIKSKKTFRQISKNNWITEHKYIWTRYLKLKIETPTSVNNSTVLGCKHYSHLNPRKLFNSILNKSTVFSQSSSFLFLPNYRVRCYSFREYDRSDIANDFKSNAIIFIKNEVEIKRKKTNVECQHET